MKEIVSGEKLLWDPSKWSGPRWADSRSPWNRSYTSDEVNNEALLAQDDHVTDHNEHQVNNVNLSFMSLK